MPKYTHHYALYLLFYCLSTGFTCFAQSNEKHNEAATAKQHYQLILSGRLAGTQWVSVQTDGSIESFYSFNDRGRGDEIHSQIQLDEQGLPLHMRHHGHDYFKVPVAESFEREGNQAEWHNEAENGAHAAAQGHFYLPLHGPPEMSAILARALLAAPQHQLDLLPAGRAYLREMQRLTADLDGQPWPLVLYLIEGLGFAPEPIWLAADGHGSAQVSSWFSVLPQTADPEQLLPQLLAAQQQVLDEYARRQARELALQPSGDVLIRHARLYDPRDLSVSADQAVLIRGERIAALGPDAELWRQWQGRMGQVLDAQGAFLMPGLWDSHQHFGASTGLLDLASGVTSARDLANDSPSMLARQQRFDHGEELGPRTFLAGFMDGPGPLAGPTKALVDNTEDALQWVNDYAAQGYRQIKVYSSLKPELVAPIAHAAHAQGLRLSGHVPAYMTAEQFIRAGADEIQHVNMLFLNFLADIAPDTRDTTRFTAVAEHAHTIKPEQPAVAALIQLMQQRHIVLDPTVAIFEGMFSGAPQSPPPGMNQYIPRLPPQVGRQWLSGALKIPSGQEQAYAQALPAMLRLIKALHQAGIPIVAGTDAMPGFTLYRELELYVQAGLSPLEALQTATWIPAQVMGVEKELGSPASGSYADLILIDGDPSERISELARVQWVIKGGQFYRAAELQRALGIQSIVSEAPELKDTTNPAY